MRPLSARRPKPAPADPAPSRLAWRLERWMLTPGVRFGLRAGVPFAVALSFGMWWLSDETRRLQITDSIAEARASVEQRPEFMVNLMSVEGVGDEVAADIRDILPIDFPMVIEFCHIYYIRAF